MTGKVARENKPLAEDTAIHGEVVREIGVFIMKTLITLNSGAAIVLLTFTGTTMTSDKAKIQVDLEQLRFAMLMFLAGITGAMITAAVTYFSGQAQYAGWRPSSQLVRRLLIWGMALPALVGFIAFGFGFYVAATAITAR